MSDPKDSSSLCEAGVNLIKCVQLDDQKAKFDSMMAEEPELIFGQIAKMGGGWCRKTGSLIGSRRGYLCSKGAY